MHINQKKATSLKDAISRYVTDGCHLSIGGFTVNRNPMAAVYEIIRQKRRNLHCYAHSNGTGIDELIGGGCVARLEIAYGGNGKAAPTCIRFKLAVQRGEILVEDYSNYQMSLRFHAGAMGLPFLNTRSGLGTDILNRWGFSRALREKDPRLPKKKYEIIDNPFGGWAGASKVVLVPAINPDVTILHVQKADEYGTCRIEGLNFADIDQAKAARHVIVTCEELVGTEELRKKPEYNQIPFIHVSAVVHMPHGAYPTSCYNHYDYDPVCLKQLACFAKDDTLYQRYLEKFVHGVDSHQGLLDLVGGEQLEMIAADRTTGYATGLDRR
ncbi:MAG: CoA transferase subunit A [Desulfopila sp.]